MKLIPSVLCVVFFLNQEVQAESTADATKIESALAVLEIMENQPDSIERWAKDKVYLRPERIDVRRDGVFVNDRRSLIRVPKFYLDKNGIFIHCAVIEGNKDAQEHFDRAREAFIDGLGHAGAAGILLEQCPPLAVYEGYKSVEAFKEFGREYSAGVECESNTIREDSRD